MKLTQVGGDAEKRSSWLYGSCPRQHYFDTARESVDTALTDLETFYVSIGDADAAYQELQQGGPTTWLGATLQETGMGTDEVAGWYYWACFPGCLPDSDPSGPFESEAEALDDARSW